MPVSAPFNWEGVSISTTGTLFTAEPAWTRLDQMAGVRVSRIEITRGRSDEFERTDTGRCVIHLNDRAGNADPTQVDWIGRPIAIALRNPVTDTWHPRFRGVIDDHRYDLHPSRVKGDVVIECVDALDYLANFEIAPGLAGDSSAHGYVVFDATPIDSGSGAQTRIVQALGNASWPTALSSIFTGNVSLLPGIYSPGESILSVIHEAADAEFPGVANFYVDKYGVVSFHGRFARFSPASVAATATHWDFHHWSAGTSSATRAQIRPPLVAQRTRRFIRNASMCYPKYLEVGSRFVPFPAADRVTQVITEPVSISRYGTRSWSAENLLVRGGFTDSLTGPEECLSFAEYIADNYNDPHVRLQAITFESLHPLDYRADATWELLCEVDISDLVNVVISHVAGPGGWANDLHVEGIKEVISPLVDDLDTGYPHVETTLDLSPSLYYADFPATWVVPE